MLPCNGEVTVSNMQMSELLPPAIKNSVMSKMMAILFQETDIDLPICFNTLLPSSNEYILIHL